jgi:membrane protein
MRTIVKSTGAIAAGRPRASLPGWLWKRARDGWLLLKETARSWYEHEPLQSGAAISFYTIFSLPGLLVIVIAVAGLIFGNEVVTAKISGEVGALIGGDAAADIESIVARARESGSGVLASIIGIATLLFGATGVFYQIQQDLNRIWEVKAAPKQALLKVIRARVFSFGLVLAVGFMLVVSLIVSAALSAASDWVASRLSESLLVVFGVLDVVISVCLMGLLFAAIFKFLPDAKVRWREVWIGALVTSVLFTTAKFLLGLWLGSAKPGTTYGAAGTIVLIMLWVSYASIILLFGAEFTSAYAKRFGRKIEPARGAVSTDDDADGPAR